MKGQLIYNPMAGRFVLFDSRRAQPENVENGQVWLDVDR